MASKPNPVVLSEADQKKADRIAVKKLNMSSSKSGLGANEQMIVFVESTLGRQPVSLGKNWTIGRAVDSMCTTLGLKNEENLRLSLKSSGVIFHGSDIVQKFLKESDNLVLSPNARGNVIYGQVDGSMTEVRYELKGTPLQIPKKIKGGKKCSPETADRFSGNNEPTTICSTVEPPAPLSFSSRKMTLELTMTYRESTLNDKDMAVLALQNLPGKTATSRMIVGFLGFCFPRLEMDNGWIHSLQDSLQRMTDDFESEKIGPDKIHYYRVKNNNLWLELFIKMTKEDTANLGLFDPDQLESLLLGTYTLPEEARVYRPGMYLD